MQSQKHYKIFLLCVFFLYCSFLFSTAQAQPTDFQETCKKILGPNSGAILVYDIKKSRFLAVVNPEIAFNTAYKPGSLFKLITAAALLESGKIDPSVKVDCRNYFTCQGQKYTCSQPGGHGSVSMVEALADSCSIYFYQFAPRLTPDGLKSTASAFGCGRKCPLPDHCKGVPAEILTKKNKLAQGTCTPPQVQKKFLYFSIGDDPGITLTPWQVMNMTAVIASGKQLSPGSSSPLKPATLAILREGMKQAALRGTCSPLGKAGLRVAAKTGTSTNYRNPGKYHGWFTCYTPVGNPRYLVVVFLEDGRGYTDALPLGKKILDMLQ